MAFLIFPRPVESTSGSRSGQDALRAPVEFSRYAANATSNRADLGRIIRMDSSSPLTVTLQANGSDGGSNFYIGECLTFTQWGTGTVTFAAGAGASLRSFDGLVAIEGRNAIAGAVYCEGDEWWLVGQLA